LNPNIQISFSISIVILTFGFILFQKTTFMSLELFNPFENLYFSEKSCFLSGADLTHADETLSVFPEWILDRFDYRDRKFTLMDTVNSTTYGALKLPCSSRVKLAFDALDEEVK